MKNETPQDNQTAQYETSNGHTFPVCRPEYPQTPEIPRSSLFLVPPPDDMPPIWEFFRGSEREAVSEESESRDFSRPFLHQDKLIVTNGRAILALPAWAASPRGVGKDAALGRKVAEALERDWSGLAFDLRPAPGPVGYGSPCRSCDGSGKAWGGSLCRPCSGAGWMPSNKPVEVAPGLAIAAQYAAVIAHFDGCFYLPKPSQPSNHPVGFRCRAAKFGDPDSHPAWQTFIASGLIKPIALDPMARRAGG